MSLKIKVLKNPKGKKYLNINLKKIFQNLSYKVNLNKIYCFYFQLKGSY